MNNFNKTIKDVEAGNIESPSDNFINRIMKTIMTKRIFRSKTDKKIAGVCGGLANYFNVDPVIIRLLCFALFLCSGITLLAYMVAWFVIPKEKLHVKPLIVEEESNLENN